MKSSTRNVPKTIRELAYYRQRYRNRVFSKLVSFISEQAARESLAQKDIAERLNKDEGQLSRLLNHPGNLTLDTISDLLLAFEAEPEPPEIVPFKDRRPANYVHPLIAQVLRLGAIQSTQKAQSALETETTLPLRNLERSTIVFETSIS